ncbi:hypothetical protein MBAV_002255 [Candidatus Magnetobacterium bavaricum]|uniref:Uncharacterized protein n=1 Tax=Candidatus Magnetobacterium bavaricum TaxID=29290 RepID=A0A0F3GUB2_9BACT|nr:hypothetical protein MBAV_002255 [Candidatus Magnetobacterium bavaricum]
MWEKVFSNVIALKQKLMKEAFFVSSYYFTVNSHESETYSPPHMKMYFMVNSIANMPLRVAHTLYTAWSLVSWVFSR